MNPKMYPQGKNEAQGAGLFGSVVKSAISAPTSGPTGTGKGTFAYPNAILFCSTSKALFVNEGTLASPYWWPINFDQRGLVGAHCNFRNHVQLALSDTTTSNDLGDGVKVSGQGIAETDAGMIVTLDELGRVARMTTTDEVAHTMGLSPIGTAAIFQPDTHGPFVVDTEFTNISAITLREVFVGFCGSNAHELDPIVTSTTVTVSFAATIGDDVAGLYMGSALTLASTLMAIRDKGNANATQLVTAAGVNTGQVMPAAATYGRFRVECDAQGNVRYFFNKAQIGYAAAALDVDEEHSPLLQLCSNSTAVKSMDVKHFSFWGVRP